MKLCDSVIGEFSACQAKVACVLTAIGEKDDYVNVDSALSAVEWCAIEVDQCRTEVGDCAFLQVLISRDITIRVEAAAEYRV
jgi:hypothetical protein